MDLQEKIKRNIYSYLKRRKKSSNGLSFVNPDLFFQLHDEIERMKKVLSKLDLKISQYESWYSVIYKDQGQ